MGGRGASSGVGRHRGGGGIKAGDILDTTSFISARSGYEKTVDDVLGVLNSVNGQYGYVIDDIEIATLSPKAQSAIAYCSGDKIGWNKNFMDGKRLDSAYDDCVKSGFHPKRGKKSAAEAVAAHEIGHALTHEAGRKMGGLDIDRASTRIVSEARKKTKHRGVVQMASKVSKYATESNAEAIAEAFSDVYCNGSRAKSESRAIVSVMNSYLK